MAHIPHSIWIHLCGDRTVFPIKGTLHKFAFIVPAYFVLMLSPWIKSSWLCHVCDGLAVRAATNIWTLSHICLCVTHFHHQLIQLTTRFRLIFLGINQKFLYEHFFTHARLAFLLAGSSVKLLFHAYETETRLYLILCAYKTLGKATLLYTLFFTVVTIIVPYSSSFKTFWIPTINQHFLQKRLIKFLHLLVCLSCAIWVNHLLAYSTFSSLSCG